MLPTSTRIFVYAQPIDMRRYAEHGVYEESSAGPAASALDSQGDDGARPLASTT